MTVDDSTETKTSAPSGDAESVSAAPGDGDRLAVLVAGSGRSGTSTLAGILRSLDVYVPQPEIEADDTNPLGFSEPAWLVEFHDELLDRRLVHPVDARPEAWMRANDPTTRENNRARASQWLGEQFDYGTEVVLKDPRLIWFYDLWRIASVRNNARVAAITMLRHPATVVASRITAYGLPLGQAHGVASWINLMLHTERATREDDRAFVRYEDLLDDWTKTIASVGEELRIKSVTGAQYHHIKAVNNFIDPSLNRSKTTSWEGVAAPAWVKDLAERSYQQLSLLADEGGDNPQTHAKLDELREEYVEQYSDAEEITRSTLVATRRKAERVAERELANAGGVRHAVKASLKTRLGIGGDQ